MVPTECRRSTPGSSERVLTTTARLHFPLASPLAERLSGTPLVLLLDIDGTLAPIAARPIDATVPEETRQVLAELVAMPDTYVVVAVSGRAVDDARRMLDTPAAWVIGNHGVEIGEPGKPPRRSRAKTLHRSPIRSRRRRRGSPRSRMICSASSWRTSGGRPACTTGSRGSRSSSPD